MIGFALGNALGPQFWLDKYKPTNRVPWGLTLMAALTSIGCTFALRYLFARPRPLAMVFLVDFVFEE